jgi:hypothetical protein
MSKLKIIVLYDRVLVDEDEEQATSSEKSPVTRTLDKKEVEEEVADGAHQARSRTDDARARRDAERACWRWRDGMRPGVQP